LNFFISALLLGLAYSATALGIFLSLRIFRIPDITTDGSFTFGGAVTAVLLAQLNLNPYLVLPAVALAGALTGMATGLIHTRLNIHPLLAGIIVMTGMYSISLGTMGRSNIPLITSGNVFKTLPFTESANLWLVLTFFSFLLLILLGVVLKTDFGIAMRATGDNEQMAIASGVNTQRMKITGLAIANGLTALSGYMVVQYQGFADINMGIGIVISGLAAVIIGESIIRLFNTNNLWFQIFSVVAGSVIFRLLLAIALTSGLNPNYLKLITALLVLLIVSLTGLIKEERK
jgi:putative ABC transport system permease protein